MPILSGLRRQFAEDLRADTYFGGEQISESEKENFVSAEHSGMDLMQFIESEFGLAMSREPRRHDSNAFTSTTLFE